MGIHTEQQAKQQVIELVQCTKASVGFKETPQYSGVRDPIARHLGITVKEEPLPLGDEGQYIPNDPPTIALDPRTSDPDRLNFTFFTRLRIISYTGTMHCTHSSTNMLRQMMNTLKPL